jgi:BirA family biotin operon repressor/biotin-[acetyl-CoA-carboxylase] ligase
MQMQTDPLTACLQGLPLGGWRYFDTLGSTNDAALEWSRSAAPDLALVAADQQTSGRGRLGRRWVTNPGAALAFSLVLRPSAEETAHPWAFTALGALAVQGALQQTCGLAAQVKWPNDILMGGRKVSGILVENSWLGMDLEAVVIGIGINITPAAVPPPAELLFPATSVETELGHPIDRWSVLRAVIVSLLDWRPRLGSELFRQGWEDHLAFKGEWVTVSESYGPALTGQELGISPTGGLRLLGRDGKIITVEVGDLHLRAADKP